MKEFRKFLEFSFRSTPVRREVFMKINDELLEKLGIYFVYHDIYNRYGITFEMFVERWLKGILEL